MRELAYDSGSAVVANLIRHVGVEDQKLDDGGDLLWLTQPSDRYEFLTKYSSG
jgi:hypothetical protein